MARSTAPPQGGPSSEFGSIFKWTPGSGLTTLHAFSHSDGAYPFAGVIQGADGALYGTTTQGGGWAFYGTLFRWSTGSGLTTLHTFGYSEGATPLGGVIQGSDGALYGTTYGGAATYGTIFKWSASGFATLHTFNYSNGAHPYAGLIQGNDGALYGATWRRPFVLRHRIQMDASRPDNGACLRWRTRL